jgi:hypothetical protein
MHQERWASLALGPAFLVTPFVAFARHHDYGLLRWELLVCGGLLTLAGLLLGAAMALGGRGLRVLGVALLTTLLIDVQTEWAEATKLALPGIFLLVAIIGGALRDHVATIASVMLGALLLATLLLPGATSPRRPSLASVPPAITGPSPLVHLVLDEHIGVEGIPRELDRDGRAAAKLERFYVDRGFRVFGRAYSRYYDTNVSLPNLLNFTLSSEWSRGPRVRVVVGSNAYFEEMTRRGYRIDVVQSDYLDFCRSSGQISISSCLTYPLETLDVVEGAPLAPAEKARVISGVYVRLSSLLSGMLDRLGSVYRAYGRQPPWLTARVSSLSAMRVLDQLTSDLPRIGPGSLVFVHLMLPHFPYAYDAECRLEPLPRNWLWASVRGTGFRNSPVSRQQRYARYLEQMACLSAKLGGFFDAMAAAGVLDEARILVHSDHGSRIGLFEPDVRFEGRLSGSDYLDAYSTLFAVKEPGGVPAYERGELSLDELFDAWMRGEPDAARSEGPWVYLRDRRRLTRRAMPAFEHGSVLESASNGSGP